MVTAPSVGNVWLLVLCTKAVQYHLLFIRLAGLCMQIKEFKAKLGIIM